MEKVKKGQQIRELPMRGRVLTFGSSWWVLLWVLVFHLSPGLGSWVLCLVMIKDKTTVNERLRARKASGKNTCVVLFLLRSTAFP